MPPKKKITKEDIIEVALEIVREIAAEAFENTGDCDFRHFLQSNTPRQSGGASNL